MQWFGALLLRGFCKMVFFYLVGSVWLRLASAATVTSLSPDQRFAEVSGPVYGQPLHVKDPICLFHMGHAVACGNVVHVFPDKARLELTNKTTQLVQLGDSLKRMVAPETKPVVLSRAPLGEGSRRAMAHSELGPEPGRGPGRARPFAQVGQVSRERPRVLSPLRPASRFVRRSRFSSPARSLAGERDVPYLGFGLTYALSPGFKLFSGEAALSLAHHWVIGVSAGLAQGAGQGTSLSITPLALELAFFSLADFEGIWFGGSLGWADFSASSSVASQSTWSPAAGLSTGYQFRVLELLRIGVGVGAQYFSLPSLPGIQWGFQNWSWDVFGRAMLVL